MSLALDIADLMAARLNAANVNGGQLAGVTTLVDRQKDIAAEVAKRVAQAGAAVVTILWEGFSNPDARRSGNISVVRRYTATIYAKPVLREAGELTADDIAERAARLLHDWDPEAEDELPGFIAVRVVSCDLRPDTKHLIYDLDIEADCTL